MNIYAKPGSKIIYCNPKNGYTHDQEKCHEFLHLHQVYTVNYTIIYQSSSDVCLKEIPNINFNTVMFEDAEVTK